MGLIILVGMYLDSGIMACTLYGRSMSLEGVNPLVTSLWKITMLIGFCTSMHGLFSPAMLSYQSAIGLV